MIRNILSPSNYAEFNRLLNSAGLVVKIISQSDYLKELREIVFDEPEKQVYSNVETLKDLMEISRLFIVPDYTIPSLLTIRLFSCWLK